MKKLLFYSSLRPHDMPYNILREWLKETFLELDNHRYQVAFVQPLRLFTSDGGELTAISTAVELFESITEIPEPKSFTGRDTWAVYERAALLSTPKLTEMSEIVPFTKQMYDLLLKRAQTQENERACTRLSTGTPTK